MEYDHRINQLVTAAIQQAGSGFALALKLGVTPEIIYDWRDCKASPPESYLTLMQNIAAGNLAPTSIPSWHFVLHTEADPTWTWRRIRVDGSIEQTSEPHSSFGHSMSDAIDHGFRPKSEAWVVIQGGRYIHFRAGERPIAIPDDRDPAAPLNIQSAEPELANSRRPVKTEDKSAKS